MHSIKLHRLLLFVIGILWLNFGTGQLTPEILKPLLAHNGEVSQILMRSDTAFFTGIFYAEKPTLEFPVTGRSFVKTKEGLFLHINGSGRLYEVSDSGGIIKYRRADSTSYSGNSFGSILFDYKNQIYSLGGYGFWKSNGQLRIYRPGLYGWELLPVTEEICVTRSYSQLPWVDPKNGNLYLVSKPEDFINQTVKGWQENAEGMKPARVMRLDLNSGVWKEIGKPKNAAEWKYKVLGNAPWGLLVEKGFRELDLLDYNNLEIKRLKKSKADSFKIVFANLQGVCYFIDSTFYFGDLFKNTSDSIQLSYSDFEGIGMNISSSWGQLFIGKLKQNKGILMLIAGLLLAAFIFLRIRKGKTFITPYVHADLEPKLNNANGQSEEELEEKFTHLENMLILEIAKNVKLGKTTSIDEINRVLGVANKNLPTQKRVRSEVVAAINNKARLRTSNPAEFIKRNRTSTDRRQMEYYMEDSMVSLAIEWCSHT